MDEPAEAPLRPLRSAADRRAEHEWILAGRGRAGVARERTELRVALETLALRDANDHEVTAGTALVDLLDPDEGERLHRSLTFASDLRTVGDLFDRDSDWGEAELRPILPFYRVVRAAVTPRLVVDPRFAFEALVATPRGRALHEELDGPRPASRPTGSGVRRGIYGLGPPRDPRYGFRVRFRMDEVPGATWFSTDLERDVAVTGDEIVLKQRVYVDVDDPSYRPDVEAKLIRMMSAAWDGAFLLVDRRRRERYRIRTQLEVLDAQPDAARREEVIVFSADMTGPKAYVDASGNRANTHYLSWASSSPRVVAHELGHRMFAVEDEYADRNAPERRLRVRRRSDDSPVHSIMAEEQQGAPLPAHGRMVAKLMEQLTGERFAVALGRPLLDEVVGSSARARAHKRLPPVDPRWMRRLNGRE